MRFIGTFNKMKVELFVCLMTRNISLSSSHSHQYSTDAQIPTMPRKNRICKRIVTYCTVIMAFMMSNSINCRVHLCQIQVRWELRRDAKHFIPGSWAAFSCTSTMTRCSWDATAPLQFKPAISEGFEEQGGTVSREKSHK